MEGRSRAVWRVLTRSARCQLRSPTIVRRSWKRAVAQSCRERARACSVVVYGVDYVGCHGGA